MPAELNALLTWTFANEAQLTPEIAAMFVPGEQAYAAYRTIRDVAVFTNKRLIVRDIQGITGKKIETYSLPWSSVLLWSIENAGKIDLNAEVELWTRIGHFKINLKRGADIEKIDKLISSFVLA